MRTNSRKQLISLLLLFATPIFLAWFFIYNPEYLPTGRTNKGTLITPVVPITDFEFRNFNDDVIKSSEEYQGFWTMILIAGEQCNEDCKKRIYDMRQVRTALEKNYTKVKRLVIITSNQLDPELVKYLKHYPGTDILSQNKLLASKISNTLDFKGLGIVGNLYIMDPMHNVMMSYTSGQPAKDILSDMQRLLKINQWGAGH